MAWLYVALVAAKLTNLFSKVVSTYNSFITKVIDTVYIVIYSLFNNLKYNH